MSVPIVPCPINATRLGSYVATARCHFSKFNQLYLQQDYFQSHYLEQFSALRGTRTPNTIDFSQLKENSVLVERCPLVGEASYRPSIFIHLCNSHRSPLFRFHCLSGRQFELRYKSIGSSSHRTHVAEILPQLVRLPPNDLRNGFVIRLSLWIVVVFCIVAMLLLRLITLTRRKLRNQYRYSSVHHCHQHHNHHPPLSRSTATGGLASTNTATTTTTTTTTMTGTLANTLTTASTTQPILSPSTVRRSHRIWGATFLTPANTPFGVLRLQQRQQLPLQSSAQVNSNVCPVVRGKADVAIKTRYPRKPLRH